MVNTPVLFLIFNRPETTQRVFNEIRRQQPKHLFIAADGPRDNQPNDAALCHQTRAIATNVDWDCEVKTLFRDQNLGCGAAPASAITWFFNQVDEGIILEDDCIPNTSFFTFCETLLEKYRNIPSVMMICGTSYQPQKRDAASYYFSSYPHAWGWATWKRAWANYNFSLSGESEETRAAVVKQSFALQRERQLWVRNFRLIINGLDAWDYQWMYWIWKNKGVCVVPWQNMISNIGFGSHATHTFDNASSQAAMKQHNIMQIIHPVHIAINKQADQYERFNILIEPNSAFYLKRIKAAANRIRRILFVNNDK
jgi:hypothetical protein